MLNAQLHGGHGHNGLTGQLAQLRAENGRLHAENLRLRAVLAEHGFRSGAEDAEPRPYAGHELTAGTSEGPCPRRLSRSRARRENPRG